MRLGQQIAAVGDSGDSLVPHLHFQVQDSPDFGEQVRTVPIVFRDVVLIRGGRESTAAEADLRRGDHIRRIGIDLVSQPQEGLPNQSNTRRGLGAWIRRGLVWMIAGLLALGVIGAAYQAVATEIDQRAYPPPAKWWMLAITACTSTALDRAARP